MTIKTGSIVSHAGALEWGAGKVIEVTATTATIHFTDGKHRKIAASHFTNLQPAAASSFTPPLEPEPLVKALNRPRTEKKKK